MKSEVKAALITGTCTIIAAVIALVPVWNVAEKRGEQKSISENQQTVEDKYDEGYDAGYMDGYEIGKSEYSSEPIELETKNIEEKSTPKHALVDITPTSKIGNIKFDNISLIDCGGLQHSNVIWSNSTDDSEYITFDVSEFSVFSFIFSSPATEDELSYYCNVKIYLDGVELEELSANGVYGVKNPESFRLNISEGTSLKLVWINQYVEVYPRGVIYDAYLE